MFSAWPLVAVVRYSTLKTDFIQTRAVGLANYARILAEPVFMRSWLNSLAYMAFMIVGVIGVALMIALMTFTLPRRWHDGVRIAFYVPVLSAGIIIAQIWRWIWHTAGPVNWALGLVGVEPVRWFAQAVTALPAISIVVVTSGIGGDLIILLAAISAIDSEIFDAARIAGASWSQIKLRIVVPALRPILWLLGLVTMIGALQVFETIFALAPYDYTATVAFHVYREAFQFGRYGLASAQAVMLLLVTVGLALVKRKVERA